MTIKKTVTPAVVAANKANSQKASGPRTDAGKQKARTNATRHRLLAARLVLDSDEERADLEALVDWVYQDRQPEGAVECMLAQEIAVTWKKLQIAQALESAELRRRREGPQNILSAVFASDAVKLPVDGSDLQMDGGWEINTVTVWAGGDADSTDGNSHRDVITSAFNPGTPIDRHLQTRQDSGKRLEIQATLGSSIDRITRYQAHLKRDLFRAIEGLRRMQAERLGLED